MLSIQTNVNALVGEQNLSVNNAFQSKTIQRLTSGFRINSSADDAAGLAVANRFRSDTAELQQGVRNANDGVSQLQIVDGGLSNISQMLDRMKTLATEASTSTFTGDRSTLNQEYSDLLAEIDRQAANVGLNNGGNMATNLSVYLGGAESSNAANSSVVSVDLTGKTVDSAGLGLTGTNVNGGSGSGTVDLGLANSGAGNRLDNPGATFLAADSQALTFNYVDSTGAVQSRIITVEGGTSGITGDQAISQLNTGLSGTGLTASIDSSNGQISISGTNGFTVTAAAAGTPNNGIADTVSTVNTTQYNLQSAAAVNIKAGDSEDLVISDGTNKAVFTLSATGNAAATVQAINAALAQGTDMSGTGTGGSQKVNVTAMVDGTGISFQSSGNFSVVQTANTNTSSSTLLFANGDQAITLATGSAGGAGATANATAALDKINAAVALLGKVQGIVGAGENKLNYAIQLAQSQITNYSAAESQIRDADVATEAANLTKAQVLQQASMAAMAQANSAPQAVLTLLRG